MPGGAVAPIPWIREQMVNVLKHARSDVTQAVKHGRERPWFCSAQEWEQETRLHSENPRRYAQQEEAAARRLQSVGTSHLGRGGWERFRVNFVSIIYFLNSVYL